MLGLFQKVLSALRNRNTEHLALLTVQTLDIAIHQQGGILNFSN